MPRKSSGEVSRRTSNTSSPLALAASARSALKYTLPVAAPGPAGSPLVMADIFRTAARSNTGASSWSKSSAGMRVTASFQVISFSLTISQAMRTAARPVRLPLRVWSMNTFSSSIVNSKSCTSRKCFSSTLQMRSNSLCALGSTFLSLATGSGVRTPATTSSPWAFIMNSPQKTFSPVAGSRVKATPEPELSPELPNTIDCTLTAVPHSTGMLYLRR